MARKTKRERGICEHWKCQKKASIAIWPEMGTAGFFTLICSEHWNEKKSYTGRSMADIYASPECQFKIDVLS